MQSGHWLGIDVARRRRKGHYQAGPGPVGADGGVAGAESTARSASVIPSRASHQQRSCAEGVIVHFHDIFLPFEYPAEWPLEKHLFWTEQYLLHACLAENGRTDVLFASHFIATRYPEAVKEAFPAALWHGGASFWIQKR